MPHFKWQGINLSGKVCSGTTMARSVEELSSLLFNEDIALLAFQPKKPLPFIQAVSLDLKINFFKQITLLLGSGIFLDQALQLVVHQIKHRFFKSAVCDILMDIHHGVTLSNALKNYPMLFDDLTIQMVETGQESGKLVEALEQLCDHQETVALFRKKLRLVLLMPAITFLFFIIISLIIFIVIVPTFSSMFISSGQPLSKNTEYMIMISDFIRSWWSVVVVVGVMAVGFIVRYYVFTYKPLKRSIEYCLLAMPIVGGLLRNMTFAYFFQSLGILTKAGVHLVTALSIACQSIGNSVLKDKIELLLEDIQQGNSLSQALSQQPDLFSDHIIALLSVGQESGCLPFIFDQIALLYKEQVNRLLTTLATLVQPLLMIILGLLITMLVFALYVPLFNLSAVIV